MSSRSIGKNIFIHYIGFTLLKDEENLLPPQLGVRSY